MKKKLIVILNVLLLLFVFTGGATKAAEPDSYMDTDGSEYRRRITNTETSKDYFGTFGITKLVDDNRFRLMDYGTYKSGYLYYKDQLSPKYNFNVKLELEIAIGGIPADGVIFGFTESNYGSLYNNGFRGLMEGPINGSMLVLDTYKNGSADPYKVPAIYARNNKRNGSATTGKAIEFGAFAYFRDKKVKLDINYNATTRITTYTFNNNNTIIKMDVPLLNITNTSKMNFFMSSATGDHYDKVFIKALETDGYFTSEKLNKVDVTSSGTAYTFTPLQSGNVKYAQGTELYLPGINNPLILNNQGTVTVQKSTLPRYDTIGNAYTRETGKGKSNPYNMLVNGYQTSPITYKQSTNIGGPHRITPRTDIDRVYSNGSIVKFDGIEKQYTVNPQGIIEIPRSEFPEYDLTTQMTIKEGNKDVSEKVEITIPGYKTVPIHNIDVIQDYRGNIKVTPKKANGTTYAEGTLVYYKGNEYPIQKDGSVTILDSQLSDEKTTVGLTIKENDKLMSNPTSVEFPGLNDSERRQMKKQLEVEKNKINQEIDELENLDPDKKTLRKQEIDLLFKDGADGIEVSYNKAIGQDVYNVALDNMRKKLATIKFEDYADKRNKELFDDKEALKERVDGLSNLTKDKKDEHKAQIDQIYDAAKTLISSEESNDGVDYQYEQATEKLNREFLITYKESKLNEYNLEKERIIEEINELVLTPEEKTELINRVNEQATKVEENINDARLEKRVSDIVESGINDLNRLLNQGSIKEIEEAKTAYTTDLEQKATEIKQKIDELEELTTEEKKVYKDLVDSYYTEGQTQIAQLTESNTVNDAKTIYTTQADKMEEELTKAKLENYKKISLKRLQRAYDIVTNQINTEPNLTPEERLDYQTRLDTEFNTVKTNIQQATTLSAVSDLTDASLTNMESLSLEISKTDAINEINNLKNILQGFVTEMPNITTTEKEAYTNAVDPYVTDILEQIKNATGKNQVTQLAKEAEDRILDQHRKLFSLNEKRTNAKNKIEERYLEVFEKSESKEDLPEEFVIQLKAILDMFKNRAFDEFMAVDIDHAQEVDDKLLTHLFEFTKASVVIDQQLLYQDMGEKRKIVENLIDQLEYVSETDKQAAKALIDKKTQETLQDTVFEYTEVERIGKEKDITVDYYYEIYRGLENINKLRENATQQIDEHISDLKLSDPLTDELKTIINEGKNAINELTEKDAIDAKATEIISQIDEHIKQAVDTKKDEVKKELEDFSDKPINDEVKQIIEEAINKIDNSNYNKKDETDEIIKDAKTDINGSKRQQTKKDVRKELEDYAKKPMSDEVQNIISEQVDLVNDTNFDNETAINKIIEDGKIAIDKEQRKQEKENKQAEVKKELEEYAKKPISDEVQKIINDQVDLVNDDNFDDIDAINKILEDGKKAIAAEQDKQQKDVIYMYASLILLVLIIIEMIIIFFKRRSNKKRLVSTTLPLLFFGLGETISLAITIALLVIFIILFIYIIYLFLKPRKKKVENNHTVIVKVEQPKEALIEKPIEQHVTKEVVVEKPVEHHIIKKTIQEEKKIVSHGIKIKDTPVEVKKGPEKVIEKKKDVIILPDPTIVEKKEQRPIIQVIPQKDDGLYIRYNYSFVARLHQAPKESQERFSQLKNYLLSYKDVSVRYSWRNERFMHKMDPIVKVWIHGNIMDLYLNLDPKTINTEIYNITDMTGKKMHETTPVLFKVTGEKSLKQAIELIEMKLKGMERIENHQEINYTLPYRDKQTLFQQKLIKVNKL
ncbi:hypothetical protein BN85406610 [Alteracholeplasma palmae J233]|uniref:Uncharacterized protein n=1 Tax=Alteracholeplasma palmae (strain ATCC 49389 / J233) TaxID=1318466 RepID=U4KKR5_ALTPJ|nr:DUF1542 domain-containing protein [Alteracholeplasma palmae]CCV64238.1 hypothetical protein BN85406610 [Alteracholeplasma palmae J233]